MRALLASLALLAGCGLTPRDAQFTCPDGVCPAGFSCVAGLCRLGADAPGLDAPGLDVPRLDVPLDAPPPDVPGLDAPEVDSPPIDAPVVPESCLPDARRRPVDEDADGRVDEDCPYLFATPHAVLGAMPLVAQYSGVDLTADGEFLFSTTGLVGRGVYRSRRLSFDTQYGVGVEQTTTAATARRIDALTVSGDGSELILQTTGTDEISRLYASRLVSGRYATPAVLSELVDSTVEELEPYLRRDGLEIVFVRRATTVATPSVLHVARRSVPDGRWDDATPLFEGSSPTLSQDGLTLYYTDGTGALRFQQRSSVTDDFVAGGGILAHPTPGRAMRRPVFLPNTREVFYVHSLVGGGVPDEAPRASSIFRMEACRDLACPPVTVTSCAGIADGLHCYRVAAGSTIYAGAATQCTVDEHLVTVHSPGEARRARTAAPGAWLGLMGRAWATGEPFIYDEFISAPSGSQCAVVDTGWMLVSCSSPSRPVLCESEIWPVFVDP